VRIEYDRITRYQMVATTSWRRPDRRGSQWNRGRRTDSQRAGDAVKPSKWSPRQASDSHQSGSIENPEVGLLAGAIFP
jgi:hypothetical protein